MTAPASTADRAVVLLVDDQALVAEAVRRALAGEGDIAFHACADAGEAVRVAVALRPTVILQDLVLPGVDGLDLLVRYRAEAVLRNVPVLVLSTREEPKVKARAFELGADDYLVKLPDRTELLARIRHHSQAYLDRMRRDEAARVLRDAMRLREDFAHVVIHDLGNPLATILMDADELLAGAPDAAQRAALARIRDNAIRLRLMTHDMLLLAKMEEGKLRIDARPGDLLGTIRGVVRNLAPHMERRGLAFRLEADAPSLEARYDVSLVQRVLDNLVSNAIKFSPRDGTVVVRVGVGDSFPRRTWVEIEDQGPGVPEAMRERIFEKFEVGEVRKEVPQVGLGLAFCRKAVEAHGGQIHVVPGRTGGSVFRFEL